jgi:hypothetical protein
MNSLNSRQDTAMTPTERYLSYVAGLEALFPEGAPLYLKELADRLYIACFADADIDEISEREIKS